MLGTVPQRVKPSAVELIELTEKIFVGKVGCRDALGFIVNFSHDLTNTPSWRRPNPKLSYPGGIVFTMHETAEEIDALQQLLDRSASRAGPQLTGIVTAERRLTARQVLAELIGMKVLVVATVTASGEPRTSAVDGHFLHGRWLFGTDARAHKARQMKANPAVSATYVDDERVAVFTHGYVDYIDSEHPLFDACDAHFINHYKSSPKDWSPDPVFFRLSPQWMVGYASNARDFPSEPPP
jgi:general stress protein 26